MEHQFKKDVKEAAMQAKANARLAEQRAEEAKERGAEASSHSGESLKKKCTACRTCCSGKSNRSD